MKLMLTVLGGLAEFERDLIRALTGAGRARAVARGVKMGGTRTSSRRRSPFGLLSGGIGAGHRRWRRAIPAPCDQPNAGRCAWPGR
jgi:hypothetical protein